MEIRSNRWRVQLGLFRKDQPDTWERVQQQRRVEYQQLVAQYPFPDDGEDDDDDNDEAEMDAPAVAAASLDPLTAMVMQQEEKTVRLQALDLQYRKERARRNRGLGGADRVMEDEEYDEAAANLQIIDKDLERLPPPSAANQTKNRSDRKMLLRRVLFLYTSGYPDPGYRQGMHEISSYLLHALELDFPDASPIDLEADTYVMLVEILTAMLPAYDAGPTPQPLPAQSRRILSVISQHCQQLHYTLTELHTPPQLYLTKWMRLLYSREVDDVLRFWDSLFGLLDRHSIMTVLEYTAAARLLLWRGQLLQGDASSRLHLLMNLPVETDIAPLVRLTKDLLDPRAVVALPPLPVIATSAAVVLSSSPASQSQVGGDSAGGGAENNGDTGSSSVMAGLKGFSFSAVKQGLEQAKSQSETIKKKLEEKWESIAVQPEESRNHESNTYGGARVGVADDPLRRNYDDPLMSGVDWSGGAGGSGLQNEYTSAPPVPVLARSTRTAAASGGGASHPSRLLAERIAGCTSVLQDFAMVVEHQKATHGTKAVPPAVWEALADLEVVRQELASNASSPAAASQPRPPVQQLPYG